MSLDQNIYSWFSYFVQLKKGVLSSLKIQGRPLVRRIKGAFMKRECNVSFPQETSPSFTEGGPFQRRLSETGPWSSPFVHIRDNFL